MSYVYGMLKIMSYQPTGRVYFWPPWLICQSDTDPHQYAGKRSMAKLRVIRLLDVSLLCQFATWMFRHLESGRLAPLDVSMPGRFATFLDVSPPVSKLVICDTVTTSANLFLYIYLFNKMGLLSPAVACKFQHVCHCIANGIGLLHEPERAACATFCRNAILKSTIWHLRSIKITENSYL